MILKGYVSCFVLLFTLLITLINQLQLPLFWTISFTSELYDKKNILLTSALCHPFHLANQTSRHPSIT